MKQGIFISYKRGADSAEARTLYDALCGAFGDDRVRMDVDSFPLGEDFTGHIRTELARCRVVMVVIGHGFHGRIRDLSEPGDFMRMELELALEEEGTKVIPVMFDGAGMPSAEALPDSLSPLVFRGGLNVDHANSGVILRHKLIPDLEKIFAETDAHASADIDHAVDPLVADLSRRYEAAKQKLEALSREKHGLLEPVDGMAEPAGQDIVPEPDVGPWARLFGNAARKWSVRRKHDAWFGLDRSGAKGSGGFGLAALMVACVAVVGILIASQTEVWLGPDTAPDAAATVPQDPPADTVRFGDIVATLRGHSDKVNAAAFSPDGTRIVTGAADGTILRWTVATGVQIGAPMEGHGAAVLSVGWSPDGMRIVSGSADHDIRIWDAETGALIGAPLVGHTDWVWSAAFSPDGSTVASGSDDGTIIIWNALTGEAAGQPIDSSGGAVHFVAFSADGTYFLFGTDGGVLRLADAGSGHAGLTARSTAPLWSGAVSADGALVLAGAQDGSLELWDSRERKLVAQFAHEPEEGTNSHWVLSAKFLPGGKQVLSAANDGTARIWDIGTGAEVARLVGDFERVAVAPDGGGIAVFGWERDVAVYRLER